MIVIVSSGGKRCGEVACAHSNRLDVPAMAAPASRRVAEALDPPCGARKPA